MLWPYEAIQLLNAAREALIAWKRVQELTAEKLEKEIALLTRQ